MRVLGSQDSLSTKVTKKLDEFMKSSKFKELPDTFKDLVWQMINNKETKNEVGFFRKHPWTTPSKKRITLNRKTKCEVIFLKQ